MSDINAKISELEKEIATLPIGYYQGTRLRYDGYAEP